MLTNDLTLKNITLRARIAALEAPPSEGEIEKAAEGVFNEYYPKGYGTADGYVSNYVDAPKSHKQNLRRNAKAAIEKFMEGRRVS